MHIEGRPFQLTYCTNIHPGHGWEQVLANLRIYAPALKRRLAPGGPFGLGLRLSAEEAHALLAGERLKSFQEFLAAEGLYVALINGYPYGSFHGEPVKAQVFAPDWREQARLDYTLDLVEILARLEPGGPGRGVSTVPLSYKEWVPHGDAAAWDAMVRNLARVCEHMVRVKEETGRVLHLDLEPEPDGVLETAAETVAFFRETLLPRGGPLVARALGRSADSAEELLLEHIRVCLDTCHFAVEYEEPAGVMRALEAAGIRIGRVQLSSALRVPLEGAASRGPCAAQLAPLAEPVYLHQVVERRRDGALRRYRDLGEALPHIEDPDAAEWRIHFHVPLFAAAFGALGSTQAEIVRALEAPPSTGHLEIETYTWSVLPEALRLPLEESITREYLWVMDRLCAKPRSSTSLA